MELSEGMSAKDWRQDGMIAKSRPGRNKGLAAKPGEGGNPGPEPGEPGPLPRPPSSESEGGASSSENGNDSSSSSDS